MTGVRRLRASKLAAFLVAALLAFGCSKPNPARAQPSAQSGQGPLRITSPAFRNGGDIPAKYSCSGANVSPPLEWSGAPAGTQSFALIVSDPDAPSGDFTHWLLYDLNATEKGLPENVPNQAQLSSGAAQGVNDFGKVGYGGPCPPPGATHHYRFTLYAIDSKPNLKPGAGRAQVEAAMRGHVLAQAELEGLAGR